MDNNYHVDTSWRALHACTHFDVYKPMHVQVHIQSCYSIYAYALISEDWKQGVPWQVFIYYYFGYENNRADIWILFILDQSGFTIYFCKINCKTIYFLQFILKSLLIKLFTLISKEFLYLLMGFSKWCSQHI